MTDSSQRIPHSPYSYRNDRLRQLQRKPSTSSNPFIAGVDASDLWLSPPTATLDGEHDRATSLPAHPSTHSTAQGPDFTLLGGDTVLPSFSYSSPPSPGTWTTATAAAAAGLASSSSSAGGALFPSIDSWIHQSIAPDRSIADDRDSENNDDSPFYFQEPTYSPPSSTSPSSSSASSTSALPVEPQRQPTSSRRRSSRTMANVNNNPAVITTEGGAFNVNSKSNMKDACSYDLRDHQEPATVQKEYGGNSSENKDLQG